MTERKPAAGVPGIQAFYHTIQLLYMMLYPKFHLPY